jgi:hypothetical protein
MFAASTKFGPGEANEIVLSTSGIFDSDVFIARLANDTAVPNRPPIAADQSVTTAEDTSLTIALEATDPDNDPLTYSIVAAPSHGVLSGTPPQVVYTPNANYYGPDSFTFRAFDGAELSNVATVTIVVTPVNDVPVADSQALVTTEDTPLLVTLTGHDVDGDPLEFTIVNGPPHGTLSGTSPTLTYTPNLDYVGPDSFTFTVAPSKRRLLLPTPRETRTLLGPSRQP